MLSIIEIEKIVKENNISLYETNFCFDEDIDIILKKQEILSLIQIAKENGVNSLFYAYDFVEKEEFEIYDDDLMDRFGEISSEIENAKNIYNEKMDTFDFSKPIALAVYLVLNGLQVGFLLRDPWDKELPCKEIFFDCCEVEIEKAFEKERDDDRKKTEKVKEEIVEFLKATDEWHNCTNQRLRKYYCQELVKEYNERYGVDLYPSSIDIELEVLWNHYKNNK